MRLLFLTAAAALVATPASAQGALDRLMALDANADGAISRAEARAGREDMFDRLDADRNGYLSETERNAARGDRASQALGRADTNSDGQISRAEAIAAPYRGFDRLDANNDDIVSSQEIEAARARFGGG